MTRIAEPVLTNLANGTLRLKIAVESTANDLDDRRRYTQMEAIGRLRSGIAPWREAQLEAGSPQNADARRLPVLARRVSNISAKEPENVAKLLRNWINEGDR